ncbi:MAG: NADH-quinone oxidoreductase subunit J [Gammaproteobacteria bacterium]|nr:NADH-quinone oxidoreductase subunit J [Gammaproteobacteria bacterium]MCB1861767.1 NADH-quinone oxidoreductase subunit J [Gammaproteobacteria bacterium]MCB1871319.1 NADH-quinone oxidoreductase subunit J [Gammaproteobacteria bacterium]MCB1881825.1 NADH-quinone oxidoreductase subunit J [Gammaproteobacteria bacterium]MCB1903494.1 NADH-quinone oxidoreductase subunit J [Gammaproteobacteria bacterium]
MTFELFVFYVFAAILVFAATMVITRKNPVHSALFLVLAFFTSAAIWLLAEAEFLAIVLVLVYVGAVMVLFLFVVMMLDIDIATMRAGFVKNLPLAILIAVAMVIEIFLVIGSGSFGLDQFAAPLPLPADYNNTASLGKILYTEYMYPFEVAAVILLVAIIAAIGLTMRKRPETKYQDPSKQVRVKKGEDRITVLKMDAED